jgi:hypothetical protein
MKFQSGIGHFSNFKITSGKIFKKRIHLVNAFSFFNFIPGQKNCFIDFAFFENRIFNVPYRSGAGVSYKTKVGFETERNSYEFVPFYS